MNKKKQYTPGRKSVPVWILLIALFIGELFFYTWCRVQCVNTGYEISEEAKKYARLRGINRNLNVEHERLKSPERISRIAREKLGLVFPGTGQTVIMP